jgi:hypothetical protein
MSNGNDHPNFPPPPSEPPETGRSTPRSEDPKDEGVEGSTASDTTEETQAMPAPDFDEDPAAGPEPSEGSTGPDDQAPPLHTPDQGADGSDAGAPDLPAEAPDRPTVAPAASQQNQTAQHSDPSAQNGGPSGSNQSDGTWAGPPAGPYPGAPNQADQYQSSPYQNASGQGGSAYPGGQGQPGQHQPGQYQTGSGPDEGRTGSGPGQSQAIPQPAPAPGFAGSQAAATRADARPEKKKSKLPLFITLGAVALVAVLVLVGFLVVGSVNKNNYGPDKVAEDYVAALNKGDFAAAEKIAASPRPEGTNVDLLSKEFTDASSAKIDKAKVESSTVDGDKGTVVVSYELDGTAYNVELSAKKDGKQDLFFDKWSLTGPELNVVSLDIPAADGLTVNGEEYKAKSGTTSFAVYPGSYDFEIPSSKWVSEASDTAQVNFPKAFTPGGEPKEGQVAPTTLNLDLSPTKAFKKEVQKQVEAELKKCFDNKSIEPKCDFIKFDPSEIPVGGSDKKLDDLAKKDTAKWDMKEMPKVKASFGAGDTNTGSFFTEKPGKFDFTVDGKKAGSSYFSNGNSLSVSGSVKVDGDKLSVEFFDF